ncbi:hypothetical protein [Mycobacterium sp. OTB74]|uniref:DUF7373 family lipoprotein n=1 Tax=Mycobacterium sp. OTB74 TaxID=1853452 RepID=UPI002473EF5F|nr:hypothetical protein [Mycobacterium sp. OTB74]MDH6243081.1 hypothetical protein [Mycobacterium sp. OTB74]
MTRRLLVIAASVLVLAGCAHNESGKAEKPAGGPSPGAVEVNLLGSGNFPVKPMGPLGTAGAPLTGALIDARRMADYVVGPWEVDPRMVLPSPSRAMVISDATSLGLVLPIPVANTVKSHNLIYGFSSDRQDPSQWRLMNAVLRFADSASASAAAADLSQAVLALSPTLDHAVPIPGHPDAQANTYSYNLNTSPDQPVTVYSFTPHGSYVLCQLVYAPQQDQAAAAVGATLDAQQPRIDQFVPTDPAQFASLPVDPSGLLSHTMSAPTYPDPPGIKPHDPKIGTYLPRAALHLQDDPAQMEPAFTAAGLQAMTFNQTTIYRVRDAAGASKLVSDLAAVTATTEVSAHPANAVDFMPGSQCVQSERNPSADDSMYYCFAALNNLVIAVQDPNPTGARQETAAQYKMLLAP